MKKAQGRFTGCTCAGSCIIWLSYSNTNTCKSKVNTDIAVRNRNYHIATGNHMPYGITQCYLPPGRGDFAAFTPAEAGTRFSEPRGMQG